MKAFKRSLLILVLGGLGLSLNGCKLLELSAPAKPVATYRPGEHVELPWSDDEMRATLKPGARFSYTLNQHVSHIEVSATRGANLTYKECTTKPDLASADLERRRARATPKQTTLRALFRLGEPSFEQGEFESCRVFADSRRFEGKRIAALRYVFSSPNHTVQGKVTPLEREYWLAKDTPGVLLERRAKLGGLSVRHQLIQTSIELN